MVAMHSFQPEKKLIFQSKTQLDILCEKIKSQSGLDASIKNSFINISIPPEMTPSKPSKPAKMKGKPKIKHEDEEEKKSEAVDDPNDYRNYLDQFADYQEKDKFADPPVHKYTISIHRAVFNEEFFEVYKKFELAVHKKEQ